MKQKVWDLFVRFFHWSLVLSFTVAYLAAEFSSSSEVYDLDEVHEFLGYFITILVVTRIIWGFVGSKYARFSSFIFSPSEYIENFKAIATNKHQKHYVGHNPLGGAMVFALLGGLSVMVFSGLILLGWSEYTGPVWALALPVTDTMGDMSRWVHYHLAEVMLVLVGAHILGVFVAMKQHGENLVRSMFTGFKES
ncbi:MAG: cytochrome b/b6 domain-containing protein [Ghiorsea sp.]|nr:cytochrome b/b6 domain-containing protein [Ghiorsea sp.]